MGEDGMSSWLIYALLSALCAAFVSIFGKVGVAGLDSSAATAVRAVIMAVFLIGVVIAEGHTADLPQVFADKKALIFVALSGVAGALSWLFYFMALKDGAVTQVAPIDKLSVVFAVVIAVLIFGERVSFMHGIAIVMIAAGGLLLAIFP
ncbi:putative membrane protein [Selenomonas sp. oral taxon 138 str. F0429]|nr:putative membrane protein [Selenomonas sp. oral taxon 138 str. F0429]